MDERWYAVYTRPRWEKKVAELLTLQGIQNYCPMTKVARQWSDRKKVLLEPLFTSYVFVHIPESQIGSVKKINGVLNLVHWLGKPAVIKDAEIEAIRQFLKEYSHAKLEKVQVSINDAVKVSKGFLQDREGTVVAIKNNTVRVALPSLGYVMYAEVEQSSITKINA